MRIVSCGKMLQCICCVDDSSCAACSHPDTFESVIDNFCTAEFGKSIIAKLSSLVPLRVCVDPHLLNYYDNPPAGGMVRG